MPVATITGRIAPDVAVTVTVRDGRVEAVDAGLADPDGPVLAPGLVDLQVNGAGGHDLTEAPRRLWDVAALLPRTGVTAFLPTLVSPAPEVVREALAVLAEGPPPGWHGARPLGWHLEGPMLGPRWAGAHPRTALRPADPALAAGWSRAAGIVMVTLAPELPGATGVIRELVRRGVIVSLGHTGASEQDVTAAMAAGATCVTHLFNTMAPFTHREPGLVGTVLAGVPLSVSLIADGVHLSRQALAVAWRALDPARRILVSDATAPMGAPPGVYRLAGRPITSDGRMARDAEGRLAGSAAGLDTALRTVVAATGCPFHEAVDAAARNPAQLAGHEGGAIRVGGPADLVVLDPGLHVRGVLVGGTPVSGAFST